MWIGTYPPFSWLLVSSQDASRKTYDHCSLRPILQAYENLGKYFHALIAGVERNKSHKYMDSSRRKDRQKVTDAESRFKLGVL